MGQQRSPNHVWRARQNIAATLRRRREPNDKLPVYIRTAASWMLDIYFREMRKFPKLTSREQFDELGEQLLNGQKHEARNKLVQHCLRYAASIANQYIGMGIPYVDLIQQANLGLIIAAERYDYRKGAMFLTYAEWWVRQQIIEHISMYSRQVFLRDDPQFAVVRRLVIHLTEELGAEPTIEELEALSGFPAVTVRRCLMKLQMIVGGEFSLDSPLMDEDGERTAHSLIPSRAYLQPDQYVEARELLTEHYRELVAFRKRIRWVIDDRAHDIFILRYGLGGDWERQTLDNIAQHFQLTRERVRQVLGKSWEKLEAVKSGWDEVWMDRTVSSVRELEELVGSELKEQHFNAEARK